MKKLRSSLLVLLTAILLAACAFAVACDNDITITFVANGGTEPQAIVAAPGDEVELPTTEKEGFFFEGWFAAQDLSGDPLTSPVTAPDDDVTYYAKWTALPAITLDLDGGTLDKTTYYLAAGSDLNDYLKDKIPTKTNRLFGEWLSGDKPLAAGAKMPADGITLKAHWKVPYTAQYYLQNLDKSDYVLDNDKTATGFDYVGAQPAGEIELDHFHFNGELTEAPVLEEKDDNVAKYYYDRLSYTVFYNVNTPNGAPDPTGEMLSETLAYETEYSVRESAFAITGYRFAGWSTTIGGPIAYKAGAPLRIEDTIFLYAVWDKGYTDIFGGNDFLYAPAAEEGVVYLERYGLEEKTGEYDAATGVFDFAPEAGELSGKIVGDKFYYYRDTVERNYPALSGDDTLELKAKGAAVYTPADGAPQTGVYDVDPETGFYSFAAGETKFNFRLVNSRGNLVFEKQGSEAGNYLPSDELAELGVIGYYLDGFGGGKEIYADDAPYVDEYTEESATELPITYSVLDASWDSVVYTLVSYLGEDEVNYFDFRILPGADGAKGTFERGDGLTGTFDPSDTGYPLHFDGFGRGKYGNSDDNYKYFDYTLDRLYWYEYDTEYGTALRYYDAWVTYTIDGEEKIVRPSETSDGRFFEWINEPFGKYDSTAPVTVEGMEFEKAFLYVFGDGVTAYLYLLYDVQDDIEIWLLYDGNLEADFEADEEGVYTLDYGGTKLRLDHDAKTLEVVPADGESIVFLTGEDGGEKLEIRNGTAYYTPANGEETEVPYTVEGAAVSAYTFKIGGKERVFIYAVFAYTEEEVLAEAQILDQADQTASNYTLRIALFGDYAAVAARLESGAYRYFYYGTVTPSEEDESLFTFECDYFAELFGAFPSDAPAELANFSYRTQEDGFILLFGAERTLSDGAGTTLTLKEDGNAEYKTATETKHYVYEVYASYYEEVGYEEVERILLYVVFNPANEEEFFFVKIDEEQNLFKRIDSDLTGFYYDLVELYSIGSPSRYFMLDGDGTVLWATSTGYSMMYELGTYTVSADPAPEGFDPYELTFGETKLTIAISYANMGGLIGVYLERQEPQHGNYNVKGGGTLSGDGYIYYEDLGSIFNPGTFVDANGESVIGILERGRLDDSRYNTFGFTPDEEGNAICFTVLEKNGDSYSILGEYYFDLVDEDGTQLWWQRDAYSGTYRKLDGDMRTNENLYLDGHGKATLYEADGTTVAGHYCYEEAPDLNGFRLFEENGDGTTKLLVALYRTVLATGEGEFEYSVYEPLEHDGSYVGTDWSYLKLDGYSLATYVDRYGARVEGNYSVKGTGFVTFYPVDQSANLYFKLTGEGGFAPFTEDFYIEKEAEGDVLYAYLGTNPEVRIPKGVKKIASGAFLIAQVTSVDFNEVEEIEDEVFISSSLTVVSSENLKKIGARAFENIYNLTTLYLPNVTEIGEEAFISSRVTSVTLGKIEKIGARAFSHYQTVPLMTLDLTAVADASRIEWGEDVFTRTTTGTTLDAFKTPIALAILVKDIDAVNDLYKAEALATVKGMITIGGDSITGNYLNLKDGNVYGLQNGALYTMKTDMETQNYTYVFMPDTLVTLFKLEGDELWLYTPKADGTGYEEATKAAGTKDGFFYDGGLLLSLDEEHLYKPDNKNLSITITASATWNGATITYSVKLDGETAEAWTEAGALFIGAEDAIYRVTFTSATECTLETFGTLITKTEEEQWRISLVLGSDGTLTVRKFETYSYGWSEQVVTAFVKQEDGSYLLDAGGTYSTKYRYSLKYENGEVTLSLIGEKKEKMSDQSGSNYQVSFVWNETEKKIVEVYAFYVTEGYGWKEVTITDAQYDEDGTATITADGTTYKLIFAGGYTYSINVQVVS